MADRIVIPESSSKDLKLNNTKALDSKELSPVVKNDIIASNEKEKEIVKSSQPSNKNVEDFTSLPDDNMPDDAPPENYVPVDAIIGDELDAVNAENIENGVENEPVLDLDDSENSNLTEEQYAAMEFDASYGYFYENSTTSTTNNQQITKSNNIAVNPNEIIKTVGNFCHPTNNKGRITSDFGFRIINMNGIHWEYHGGIDIGGLAEGKDKVYAIADGVVYDSVQGARNYKSYTNNKCPSPYNNGNCVRIRFEFEGKKYEAIYMHLDVNMMKVGDKVKKGQVLGLVGNTGYSGGCHLHFEIRCVGYKKFYRINYKNKWNNRESNVLAGGYYGVRKISENEIENITGDFVPPKTFFSY